jgi:hypothetical protein
MDYTRTMPPSYRETIETRLAALNKTALKLGMPALLLECSEPYAVKIPLVSEWGAGSTITEWKQDFTVRGEMPALGGWSFVGTLEPAGESTLVRAVPGRLIPESYWTASPDHCDHCNVRRARSQTFVVIHAESGTHRQVGRSCLRDFLGHDPAKVLSWIECFSGECDDGWGSGGFAIRDYGMAEVIAMTMLVLRDRPYAGADARLPTRFEVAEAFALDINLSPAQRKAKAEAWREAQGFIDKGEAAAMQTAMQALSGTSDYAHNVRALARLDFVRPKDLGYIVSAVHVCKKQRGEALAHAERPAPTLAAVAEPGAKVRISGVVISAHKYSRPSYSYNDPGVSQIIVLRDEKSGALVKHFTSNLAFDAGARIELSGTVKCCEIETFEKSPHKGSMITMLAPRARLKVV